MAFATGSLEEAFQALEILDTIIVRKAENCYPLKSNEIITLCTSLSFTLAAFLSRHDIIHIHRPKTAVALPTHASLSFANVAQRGGTQGVIHTQYHWTPFSALCDSSNSPLTRGSSDLMAGSWSAKGIQFAHF